MATSSPLLLRVHTSRLPRAFSNEITISPKTGSIPENHRPLRERQNVAGNLCLDTVCLGLVYTHCQQK